MDLQVQGIYLGVLDICQKYKEKKMNQRNVNAQINHATKDSVHRSGSFHWFIITKLIGLTMPSLNQ